MCDNYAAVEYVIRTENVVDVAHAIAEKAHLTTSVYVCFSRRDGSVMATTINVSQMDEVLSEGDRIIINDGRLYINRDASDED